VTVPTATYRVQLSAAFTFDDVIEQLDRLAALGVSHLYLSPILQAATGSEHGYDVVDHGRVDDARGGEAGLRRLARAARSRGLGLVADIVPNHMSVADPRENRAWWDVLRHGRQSEYAAWFDIDWEAGPLLLPVLGDDGDVPELEVVATSDGPELAYRDRRFPLAPGTDGGTVSEVHLRQAYRLVGWRRAATELTYRRFFDISTLAGIRVEDPAVYAATHRLLLKLLRDGVLDGLRVDHPDGLADPGGYLDRLSRDGAGAWIVVEKILEPGEELPRSWPVAGSTGYDAARLVGGLFVDPAGAAALHRVWRAHGGTADVFAQVARTAKRSVCRERLAAEVQRLARLAPTVNPQALVETLVQFAVYRSYLPDSGRAELEGALLRAAADRPDLGADVAALADRLADPADPLAVRFQQTSGMIMAKGVEDTAFYRYLPLAALNEVGADPGAFGVDVDEFHRGAAALQKRWPATMTTLSSHDSKRSEDVRARLVLLSELPDTWAAVTERLTSCAQPYRGRIHPADAYLLHQTLVGVGPVDEDRIAGYLRKAVREAGLRSSWTDPDLDYEADLDTLVRAVLADRAHRDVLAGFLARLAPAWHRTVLAQKLLQLTMPGVPDLYQGSERVYLALVDPDNRRPVDWTADPDAKTAVVRNVLRLRRAQPDLFTRYTPIETGSRYAVAYARSDDLIVVVPRLAVGLARDGWGDAAVPLPGGRWTDVLSGAPIGSDRLDEIVGSSAGAVLRRELR